VEEFDGRLTVEVAGKGLSNLNWSSDGTRQVFLHLTLNVRIFLMIFVVQIFHSFLIILTISCSLHFVFCVGNRNVNNTTGRGQSGCGLIHLEDEDGASPVSSVTAGVVVHI